MKSTTLLILLFCFFSGRADSYWQQDLKYKIDVSLDDRQHMLRGEVEIKYTNNSPDTLNFIMVHLYPNAYQNEGSQYGQREAIMYKTEFYFSANKDKGFIDSLLFLVDGEESFFSYYQNNKDVILLHLKKPLLPNTSITIKTPMRIKIPKVFSRIGHIGQSYYITQWYPKPAVYDHAGWHPTPYLDLGEFYGEFADYDVTIAVPSNYVLATSGTIQTVSENKFLDSLSKLPFKTELKKTKLSKYQKIVKDSITPSDKKIKIIRSIQTQVHDFAWAADKQFIVRSLDTTILSKPLKLYSYTQPKNYTSWKKSNILAAQAIEFCSEKIGPYSFAQVHIVDGALEAGSGMEYPSFTIISTAQNDALDKVIYHEVAHNWFYGILANNERDEPFMDESFTSFLESKIYDFYQSKDTNTLSYKTKSDIPKKASRSDLISKNLYAFTIGQNKNAKLNLPSIAFTEMTYGTTIYSYGQSMVNYLYNYLGENEFWTLLQGYFKQFHHKHTSIESLQNYFKTFSTKNTDWFWNTAITSSRPIDFKLGKTTINKDQTTIKLINKTHLQVPLNLFYTKDTSQVIQWIPPFKNDTLITLNHQAQNILINKDHTIPEISYRNNAQKNPIKLSLFPLIFDDLTKRNVSLMPTLGYNYYDGVMAGVAINNLSLFPKPWYYYINPMFALRSKQVVGNAHLEHNWVTYNSSWIKEIATRLDIKSYNFHETFNTENKQDILTKKYIKIAPTLNVVLDNHKIDNDEQSELNLGLYFIKEQNWKVLQRPIDSSYYLTTNAWDDNFYATIGYNHYNKRLYNPYAFGIDMHAHQNFIKVLASASLKVNYNYSKKGLNFRWFGGLIVPLKNTIDRRYNLYATNTAESDYLYNETMIGRSEQSGVGAQQIFMREGGFKTSTPFYANTIGVATQWMMTLNTTIDLPTKLPLKIYADIGTFNDAKLSLNSGNQIIVNTGLMLDYSYLKIYLPIFNSIDYSEYNKYYNKSILGKLAFELNFSLFNRPQKAISTFFR